MNGIHKGNACPVIGKPRDQIRMHQMGMDHIRLEIPDQTPQPFDVFEVPQRIDFEDFRINSEFPEIILHIPFRKALQDSQFHRMSPGNQGAGKIKNHPFCASESQFCHDLQYLHNKKIPEKVNSGLANSLMCAKFIR